MTGTGASTRLTEHGIASLATVLDLVSSASGAWLATGLSVLLPAAGTYQLDATVRASVAAVDPSNVWVSARLFDVTAGIVVPDSEVLIAQVNVNSSNAAVSSGHNCTSPIQVEYTVIQPTTIRVEGARTNNTGTATTASILANANGRTTLRYRRIA
ncbi:hypothetical protein [Streptomyces sp. NPDC001068]|uniref:hypothetical protein n=1 Tax=Streptomyces sp. NPDC001068 TaxID=3364544 RepID=UPI0036D0BFAC